MMTRKGQTAAELLAALNRDPNFVTSQKLRDEENIRVLATLKDEQRHLISDLQSVGVLVNTVWDLVNTSKQYPSAIPILAKHLGMPYSRRTKEGIARALTVEYGGSESFGALVEEFKKQNDSSETSLKWVIGNAIATIATSVNENIIIDLVGDESNGKARAMMVSTLPKVVRDNERLHHLLNHLANDGDVGVFAKRALRMTRRK
jgi:hypothetical protein